MPFDLCDPFVTFDPKLVMSQVRVHTLVIVTKFDIKLDGFFFSDGHFRLSKVMGITGNSGGSRVISIIARWAWWQFNFA